MSIQRNFFDKIFHLKLDKNGAIVVKHTLPFMHRVFLQKGKDKIYFIRTKKSHVLNMMTAKDPFSYKLSIEFKFFNVLFSIEIPLKLEKLLSANGKYVSFSKQPIQKGLIVFESFFGKSYSGQPKYIYEYLLTLDLPYIYVWVYNKSENAIKGNPTIVKRGSLDYFKYAATAEYLVNNIVFPFHDKRLESTYLQTWHGTPLKKLGYDIAVDGPEVKAREKFYNQSRGWDYLITQNKYTSDILRRAFKYDGEVLEAGYPHNDLLVLNSQNTVKQVRKKLNISTGKKVILYAPTWRDDDANGNWSFNFEIGFDLSKWEKSLGDEYVILIRMHHLITHIKNLNEVKPFAINVSDYDDIQELSLIADILITDYSSVFFDYAVTKKPILFYTYDLEEYASKLRGFYIDMEDEMPGPLCMNENVLLESIKNIKSISLQYKEKYGDFIDKFCYLDNGHSAKRVAQKVFKEVDA